MSQFWDITSDENFQRFQEDRAYRKLAGKRVVVKFEEPQTHRSLDQNALFQTWAREYARHLLKKDKISEEEHEQMKWTLQRHAYASGGFDYLITHQTDMFTGESKPARAHTSKLGVGEMHQFLNWVQAKAADQGLILESLGEYKELQEAQA